MHDHGGNQWLGPPLSRVQVTAGMLAGAIGVLIAGVQPVMFGALLAAQRIDAAQIGHIAALELFSIGSGVILADILFEKARVRPLAILSALLLALTNIATIYCDAFGILVLRGLAGLPAGALLWMATCMIVRSPKPTMFQAAFLLIQAVSQCAIAAGIALIWPGARDGVPIAIALLALAIFAFAPCLPARFTPLPKEPTVSGLPPARGWLVLAATLLLQGCIVGAWVYAEPLAKQAGLTAFQVSLAVPISLGSQLIGGTLAILLAQRRVPWFVAMNLSSIGLSIVLVALSLLPSVTHFLLLEGVFGALWTFVLVYVTPFAIENDPTRRTALLIPAALLIGSAIGPLVASAFATEHDAAHVLQLCAALSIFALLIIAALFMTRHRMARPSGPGTADISPC